MSNSFSNFSLHIITYSELYVYNCWTRLQFGRFQFSKPIWLTNSDQMLEIQLFATFSCDTFLFIPLTFDPSLVLFNCCECKIKFESVDPNRHIITYSTESALLLVIFFYKWRNMCCHSYLRATCCWCPDADMSHFKSVFIFCNITIKTLQKLYRKQFSSDSIPLFLAFFFVSLRKHILHRMIKLLSDDKFIVNLSSDEWIKRESQIFGIQSHAGYRLDKPFYWDLRFTSAFSCLNCTIKQWFLV